MSYDGVAQVLWAQGRTPRRGPRPRVSLDGIVAAAVRVADAEGLEAASMQRVAAEVGVTKMALYRHVPGKAELVALMVDRTLGEPPATGDGPWRARLAAWAQAMRDGFAAHRWLLAAAVGPRVFGPNELGWLEAGLAALDGLPLGPAERLDSLVLVGSHVRALVQQATEPATERALALALADVLASRADAYPLAAAAFAGAAGRDDAFAFGLERVLDGIEALVASR
ncbi:TetR/AcrR family transcriptional regulator [Nocardioides humi]|uniref:TetR/AcrR family transcriptional regulator n=1 Tax=Nocardioides humi TaxID=449461 RepID=A0ABN2ATW6_9ACTN|nr:TetR/AcrR family transcriptional regulator [Nocardioides humi]